MRDGPRGVLGALGVAALLTAGAITPSADAVTQPRPVRTQSADAQLRAPGAARTCYAQLDHDAFSGIISQNFEPSLGDLDAQAADDFVLSKPCRRPVLYIDGSYGEGQGSADSFNVTIYRATKHGPGKVERQRFGVPYTEPCGAGWGCAEITLRKTLKPGHWWLSVQANLDYGPTGTMWQWWTNETVRTTAAMWRNPADGFGTGCTTYTDLITCVGSDVGMGGDLSFSISSS